MELKLGDVYRFQYNEENKKKIFMYDHCFDGQLVVRQRQNGELYLEDTYLSVNDSSNKTFTLEKALERGELTFICNMDDVEKCGKYNFDYYADEDLFDLSYQHRCYRAFYKRKGAKKSAAKMEQVLKDRIKQIEGTIKNNTYSLERARENLEKLRNGDLNIYI